MSLQPKDKQNSDLESATRALRQEADALLQLADNLGEAFVEALNIMQGIEGRVVVTGMGKSGHIGNKIAATLASTGTPAFFLHPAEASHGDLGMVTAKDAILALSNSGNTAELGDILAFSKRFAIPLIAITKSKNSTLGAAADVFLALPDVPEACPMGLAPTTSTTATLALGDALAIALLDRRAFKPEDFRELHPGGALGNKLLRVDEVMHSGAELPLCQADLPMSEAILVMTQKRFGCVGVLDEAGRLAGIVTDGDLRRNIEGLLARSAGEVMTGAPKTIGPQALAAEALGMMNRADKPFTSLFVRDDAGKPIGILHIHDLLRAGIA